MLSIGRLIDRMISVPFPKWGMERMAARATMEQISSFTGSGAGYEAGKLNRLSGFTAQGSKDNALPQQQITTLRERSWHLYRNNPHARKIVRSTESRVIGEEISVESLAVDVDGNASDKFRKRAKQLWEEMQAGFDFRGMPGQGGQSFVGLQKMALRAVMLGGGTLIHPRILSDEEMKDRSLPIPLAIQLIDIERLWQTNVGIQANGDNVIYRGIELDKDGRRVNYWISETDPTISGYVGNPKPVPASEIIHLFVEDDIDQFHGVPWFAPALLKAQRTEDYEYNELVAAAMSACIVLGVKRATGGGGLGLNAGTAEAVADADGNTYTKLSPGMILNLGKDGAIEGFNPMRPGGNAEAFIQHLLRSVAGAFPGVKTSTVTGDFRNSSFSSERSAENDAFPEIKGVQEWFASHFLQPVYDRCLDLAVFKGYFAGIVTNDEYTANKARFQKAKWQGPVSLSITPKDDVQTSLMAIQAGISTPQIECAKLNRNWRDIVIQYAEFIDFAEEQNIPVEFVNSILGMDKNNVLEVPTETNTGGAGNASQQTSNAA